MSRSALVTGGTSGIGRAAVERLRRDGATVVFTGRDQARGEAVAAATGATFLRCDVRDREASDRAFAQAVELCEGRLDGLVANAGILASGPLTAIPREAFAELLEVNLTALFRLSRAALAQMRAQGGGAIVHVASDAGIRGVATLPAYSVTKAGAIALSELVAGEGAPYGVRANALCPGDTVPGVQATPEGLERCAEDPSDWTLPPLGRYATGEDIAAAIAWLLSDEARHVTGATLRVDGGSGAVLPASTRTG